MTEQPSSQNWGLIVRLPMRGRRGLVAMEEVVPTTVSTFT